MKQQELAAKYTGEVASGYDAKRARSEMWCREQALVEEFLYRLDKGQSILDIPVGTGRFFESYKSQEFDVVGLDISRDMLNLAEGRAKELKFDLKLCIGDIFAIDAVDKCFETTVCIRIFQWIDRKEVHKVVKELCRVIRTNLIVGTRHYQRIWSPSDPIIMSYKRAWRRVRRLIREERTEEGHVFHHLGALERQFARYGFQMVDEGYSRLMRDMAASVFLLKRVE